MATDNEFLRLIYLALANSSGGTGGAGMLAAVRDGVDASSDIEAIKQSLGVGSATTFVTAPSTTPGAPVERFTLGNGRRMLLLNPPAGQDWELEMIRYWWDGTVADGYEITLNLFADRATAIAQGFRLVALGFCHSMDPDGAPIKPTFCRTAPENNFGLADSYGRDFYIQLPFTRLRSGQCLMFYYPRPDTGSTFVSYRVVPTS